MYGMVRSDRQLSSFPQAARTRRTAAVPWAGLAGVMEPVKRCTWHEVPAVDGCSPSAFSPSIVMRLCCPAQIQIAVLRHASYGHIDCGLYSTSSRSL